LHGGIDINPPKIPVIPGDVVRGVFYQRTEKLFVFSI